MLGKKSVKVWVIAIDAMKMARIIGEKGRAGEIINRRITIRFMWIPGMRPVIVPAKIPKRRAISSRSIKKHKIYLKKGRPQKESDFTWEYTIIGQKIKNPDIQKKLIVQKSCYVIGTNIKKQELESKDVIEGYKGQNSSVERGFRFLKDPLMFTSSFFIKKTERIMGLMMVMTLALLVYSIAQKQLRKAMKKLQEELPNQSGKNIKNPTLRWIFQILEGIEVIKIKIKGEIIETISGITNLKARIIGYFSNTIQKIYCLEKRSAQ